jgi:hypothetical protein
VLFPRAAVLLGVAILPATVLAQTPDHDRDGTPDAADVFPCSSPAVAEACMPGRGNHGTITFEDYWPIGLDLDFNDVALTYNYGYMLALDGRVTTLRVVLNALALGSVLDHGLGLQLRVPSTSLASA